MPNNFQRMLALVGEVFDVKNDPSQIDVTEEVIAKLHALHEATMSQQTDDDGPVAWLLMIPTTMAVMDQFLRHEITEQQLLDATNPGCRFEAIYLCSATVLPEYRNKGIAKKMAVEAIYNISSDHSISCLYYWKFSNEGEWLAKAIGKETGLPVYERL